MEYRFLDSSIDFENLVLPESDKIHPLLLKNSNNEIIKGLDFYASDGKFLYIHGFLGTGKRQIINYLSEFLNKDVIKLEYYCKQSTVCDDILLSFIDKIEKNNLAKAVNINAKITTLAVKFQQYVSSIKKPFVVILHSLDDIQESNIKLIQDCFIRVLTNDNIKLLISTKGLNQNILGETKFDKNLFIKQFSKDIYKEFLDLNKLECSDKMAEDFYEFTRGYYYYTALTIKIIQAMKLKPAEFAEKFKLSGMNFDTYLGVTYLNLIPQAIRNFFWFMRTIRHGISLNALAVWELYDEFSISYLKSNLMIFEADEILYVQDYFHQNIDISIPAKTEIKLHKYIIGIYEKELKSSLQTRSIMISRQALRAEIDYHNNCIEKINEGNAEPFEQQKELHKVEQKIEKPQNSQLSSGLESKFSEAEKFIEKEDYTQAIESYQKIMDTETIDTRMLNEIRHRLGALYKKIADYSKAQHYYELVEKYFIINNELINLNYLYYEMTGLYYLMYKNERAIDTIKKVIYSVDTPQSLMVDSCTLLGNIYSSLDNPEEAYTYYQKALESLDDSVSNATLAELYFKYALANDERGDINRAFEFYNKCISLGESLYKSPAYSNLGSCYYENGNLSDAKDCLEKAYNIEKSENNFDGIYYTSMSIAKILLEENSQDAQKYLIEAKQSAEFINEDSYVLEASIALGDFYYNCPDKYTNALAEYFNAKKTAMNMQNVDISKIEKRIKDMQLRMSEEEFNEAEKRYGR